MPPAFPVPLRPVSSTALAFRFRVRRTMHSALPAHAEFEQKLVGKIKILLSFLQISSAINFVFSVPWPKAFTNMTAKMAVFEFDIQVRSPPHLAENGGSSVSLSRPYLRSPERGLHLCLPGHPPWCRARAVADTPPRRSGSARWPAL